MKRQRYRMRSIRVGDHWGTTALIVSRSHTQVIPKAMARHVMDFCCSNSYKRYSGRHGHNHLIHGEEERPRSGHNPSVPD